MCRCLAQAPSLIHYKQWGPDWVRYYNQSSVALAVHDDDIRSSETCDCFRRNDPEWSVPLDTRENRNLTVTLKAGGTLKIMYRQCFDRPSVPGKLLQELQRAAASSSPPDVVFVNAFNWIKVPVQADLAVLVAAYEPVFQLGRELMHDGRMQVVWRTHTATSTHGRMRQAEALTAMAKWHGWPVLDAFAPTQPALTQNLNIWIGGNDFVHLLPFVYEQINDVLLNQLCRLPR